LWIAVGVPVVLYLVLVTGSALVAAGYFDERATPRTPAAASPAPNPSTSPAPSPLTSPSTSPSANPSGSAQPDVAEMGSENFTYGDGLVVDVSARRYAMNPLSIGAEPGHVGILVTVKVTNSGEDDVELSLSTVTLRAGPERVEAGRVYDDDVADFSMDKSVAPAGSASSTLAFSVPEGSLPLVRIEVDPGFKYEACHFEGKVPGK
jgi:hypothetical protein